MQIVVGDYELMAVPRSLMTPDGELISGHTGKAELTKEVMNKCDVTFTEIVKTDPQTCVVIDAMYVVNTIVPKPTWVETGDDLANEFLSRIDDRCENAETVAFAFDSYRGISLKTQQEMTARRKKNQRKHLENFKSTVL